MKDFSSALDFSEDFIHLGGPGECPRVAVVIFDKRFNRVGQLLRKMRVVAELERFRPMRLKSVGPPDTLHHRGRSIQSFGQCPRAPMGRIRRGFAGSFLDNRAGDSLSGLWRFKRAGL